jgi:hypothetical protein
VVALLGGTVAGQPQKKLLHMREVLAVARKEYVFSAVQVIEIVERLGGRAGPRTMVLKELFPSTVRRHAIEACPRAA